MLFLIRIYYSRIRNNTGGIRKILLVGLNGDDIYAFRVNVKSPPRISTKGISTDLWAELTVLLT